MKFKFSAHVCLVTFVILLSLQACNANESVSTATIAPATISEPTSTIIPAATLVPSSTPKPLPAAHMTWTHRAEVWRTSQAASTQTTQTPNSAATQQMENWNTEAQAYVEAGYLAAPEGRFTKFDDFSEEWAQLGWYSRWPLGASATNFFMSGHLKWSSAYRSADLSGCGFTFAEQENGNHYAVFLEKSKVIFTETEYYYSPIGTTRGTGRVNFGNPFDEPQEADFTLIVQDAYSYVLVDGEVVGEYSLSQSKSLRGGVGLALLSGTNKDFGTRCEITNLHLWIPEK